MKFSTDTLDKDSIKAFFEDAAGLAAICFLCFAGFALPGLV